KTVRARGRARECRLSLRARAPFRGAKGDYRRAAAYRRLSLRERACLPLRERRQTTDGSHSPTGHERGHAMAGCIRLAKDRLIGVSLRSGHPPARAQGTPRVGAARADTPPQAPIRMAGYGPRNKPSEGVDAPLRARALALQHGDDPPLVLVSAEII